MNDAPRRTLRELIAARGPGLCSDARRCEGLLRDLRGEHRREINILVGALRERVPLDLLAGRNSVPTELLLSRLAKRLEENLALTPEASRWAADSWALALGVVTDAELEESSRRREDAPVPRAEAPREPTRAATQSKPPSPKPNATRPPPHANPAHARATGPPATQTAARVGSVAAAAPPFTAATAAGPLATPRPAGAGRLQEPTIDPAARPGRGRRRGCLVGCAVLLLLLVLLALGGPLVINTLREEQMQRSPAPAPVQTR